MSYFMLYAECYVVQLSVYSYFYRHLGSDSVTVTMESSTNTCP